MSENVVEFVQALGEAGVAARSDLKSFMRADEIADGDMGALVDAGRRLARRLWARMCGWCALSW